MLAKTVAPSAGTLLGRYRLLEKAGTGGMSEVWKAEDTTLHRTVAVKVILTPIAEDASYRERFLREARLVAGLEHPNVLPVYDFGSQTLPDAEVSYLVMPLVSGGSLKARITGPMPFGAAITWLQAVAAALDHAHAKGILHRDVKPGNVLFDSQDRPMLADFGLARSSGSTSMLTQAGITLGTPRYIAPEQAQGLPLDGRTDQYALAVIAFELLTGLVPFRADSPLLLFHQHVSVPPPPASSIVSDVPAEADAVLAKALAKKPSERFPSCCAFVETLAVALGVPFVPVSTTRAGAPAPRHVSAPARKPADASDERTVISGGRPSGPAEVARTTARGRRLPVVAIAAAAVVVLLAAGAGILWRLRERPGPEVAPPPPPQPSEAPIAVPTASAPEIPPTPQPAVPTATPQATSAVTPRPRAPRATSRAEPTPPPIQTVAGLEGAAEAEEARRRAEEEAAAAKALATPAVREGDLVDISHVDTAPAVATTVTPEIPPLARRLRVEGTVVLRVLVNESGRAETVEILRDTKPKVGLGESSKEAVEKWTWTPASKDGRRVRTWTTVTIPFRER